MQIYPSNSIAGDSILESDECKYLVTQFQPKGPAWVQGFTDYAAPWPLSNRRQAQIGHRQWTLAVMMDERHLQDLLHHRMQDTGTAIREQSYGRPGLH